MKHIFENGKQESQYAARPSPVGWDHPFASIGPPPPLQIQPKKRRQISAAQECGNVHPHLRGKSRNGSKGNANEQALNPQKYIRTQRTPEIPPHHNTLQIPQMECVSSISKSRACGNNWYNSQSSQQQEMQGAVGGLTGGQGGEHVQSMQCHQQPRCMSEYGGPQQEHRPMSQQSPMTQPFHQHTLEGNSYSPPQHPERTSSIGTPGPNPRTSRPLQSKNDGSFDHPTQQGRAVDASYRPPMQPTQLWPAQNVQQYQLSNGETGFFYLNKCFPRSKSAIQIPHSPMRTPTIPAPSKHARAFSDQGAGRFTQAQSPNLPNKLNKNCRNKGTRT